MVNEIYPFGTGGDIEDGDVMALEDYFNDPDRLEGHQRGIARRELMNMALRQALHMCAGVGQFIANRHVAGVVDDGDLAKVEAGLEEAFKKLITAVDADYENITSGLAATNVQAALDELAELVLKSNGDIKNLLVAEAMRRAIGDSVNGREFLGDGWTDVLNDSTSVDWGASSGVAWDDVRKCLKPDPGVSSEVVDWTTAELENVSNVSTLTIDAADTSGHFDTAVNSRTVAGCRLVTSSGEVTIVSITGDGTAAGSVEITAGLGSGTYSVTGIYGLDFDQTLRLCQEIVEGIGTVNLFSGGTATASSAYHHGPASDAINGIKGEYGWYAHGLTTQWLEITMPNPAIVTRYVLTGRDHGGGNGQGPNPKSWLFKGYEGSEYTTYDTQSGWGSWPGITDREFSFVNWNVATKCRIDVTETVNNPGNWPAIPEIAAYSDILRPVGVTYTATRTLPGSSWQTMNSVVLTETPGNADAWYALLFVNVYRIWTGTVWRDVARDNNGTWEFRDNADTWTAAYANNERAALSEAMMFVSNQMNGATLATLLDANFVVGYPDGISVTLYTSDMANNPETDTVTFDVEAETSNATIYFDAFDAIAPDLSKVAFVMEAVDPIVLDVDVKASVKRDGLWVLADLEVDSNYDENSVLVVGDVNLAGQSGISTQMMIETNNNKMAYFHAISNTFKGAE